MLKAKKGKLQYHYSSEIYGFGTCFRKAAFYPRNLPLFFTSDHGVNLYSQIAHDILDGSIKSRFHLTWSQNVLSSNKKNRNPRIIGVRHPWFLNKNKIIPKKLKSGTVYFPYHSNPGFRVFGLRDQDAISYLKRLSEDKVPVTICLHAHDMNTDREKLFTNEGFQVISAGDGRNLTYQKDFNDLISSFKYAISEGWGSQVAYLTKMGISTEIIFGEISIVQDIPGAEKHGTGDTIFARNLITIDEVFRSSPNQITSEQIKFVDEVLGFNFCFSRTKIFIVAWLSLMISGVPWLVRRARNKILKKLKRARYFFEK